MIIWLTVRQQHQWSKCSWKNQVKRLVGLCRRKLLSSFDPMSNYKAHHVASQLELPKHGISNQIQKGQEPIVQSWGYLSSLCLANHTQLGKSPRAYFTRHDLPKVVLLLLLSCQICTAFPNWSRGLGDNANTAQTELPALSRFPFQGSRDTQAGHCPQVYKGTMQDVSLNPHGTMHICVTWRSPADTS